MSFKITKQDSNRRDQLIEDLGKKRDALRSAVEDYNQQIIELREDVQHAVDGYNEIVEQAREFCTGVYNAGQEEYDQKSDKWQDSDRGTAAREWIDEWENIEMEGVEVEWPDELMIDYPNHDTDLASLSSEAQED